MRVSARRQRRARTKSIDTTFKPATRAYAPIDVLSPEQEEEVHLRSLQLLETVGLRFLSRETWPLLEAAGCTVDREIGQVLMPREAVEHHLALAPSEFVLRARNPANDLFCGGQEIHYGSASSAPNVLDRVNGRRPGTQADFEALVKLNHMLPTCGFHSGHPVEPIDTPVNTRHLGSSLAWHSLSDKVTRIYAIGRTRVRDSVEMMRIAYGLTEDEVRAAPRLHASINVNSPLVVDEPLIEGAMELGAAGQAVVLSPVAFAGAMSPITLSGSIVQCNAECIGTIAFLQMANPGSPCFYGVLTTPIDMKSGAPAMGVPETVTGTLANGQLARRYGLPQRVMLGSTSNAPDAQGAWETMFSLWAAQLCGAHLVYHAHGWMEGGLTTGYEKTILDSEMIGMMGALRGGIDFSDMDEAMEAIADVGPGGHFLGSPHTVARYENAFHAPILSDWRAYEFWQAAGSPDAAERATARWKEMLAAYEPPMMDPARVEELEAYVARRTEEIGSDDI